MEDSHAPTLSFADIRCVRAAEGWLGLGDLGEAQKELDAVTATVRLHPLVLGARWHICCRAKSWDASLEVAVTLMKVAPDDVQSWISLAYSTRRASAGFGLEAAKKVLLEARQRFPKEELIPFNLACYEAQLGNLKSAQDSLEAAFKIAANSGAHVKTELQKMALEDPDLAPLRKK